MIHKKIKLVLKMLNALERKSCLVRAQSKEFNKYITPEGRIVEYEPILFKELRSLEGIESLNLNAEYIYNSMIYSNSGSLFFFSGDFKWVIKTIRVGERETLIAFLKHYLIHLKDNPSSFLMRMVGCYDIQSVSFCSMGCIPQKCTHSNNVLVMKNFLGDTRIDRIYDLKGRGLQRETNDYIKKDLEWYRDNPNPSINPTDFNQLKRDFEFLSNHDLMDYSLMIYYKGTKKDSNFKMYSLLDNDGVRCKMECSLSPGEYVIGIVDILTVYNCFKRTEFAWNSCCLCSHKSSTNPKRYTERLIKLIEETFKINDL